MNYFPNWYVYSLIIALLVISSGLIVSVLYIDSNRDILRLKDYNNIYSLAEYNHNLRDYDINNYNCYDFSVNLVNLYNDNGYDAKLISGYRRGNSYILKNIDNYSRTISRDIELKDKNYGAHAWVEVCTYIEATTGEDIDSKNVIIDLEE